MSVRSRDRHCICRGNDIQWRSQGSPGFSDPDTAVRIILLEHSNDAFQLGQEPSGWNGLYLLSCSYHYVPRRISGRWMQTRSLECVCIHYSPYSDWNCGRHGTQISGKKAIVELNSCRTFQERSTITGVCKMARHSATVEFTKTPKQGGSTARMKTSLYVDMKNVQLVKSAIKAKYPNDKIVFINVRWD